MRFVEFQILKKKTLERSKWMFTGCFKIRDIFKESFCDVLNLWDKNSN